MSSTNPAPYPGNSSLPREVREKILSTFRHTLNLFGQGKLDDCVIGCDFILKMDPRFGPARKLMEKARNPRADVDVAELEALVATTPTRQERVVAADPDRLLVRAVESFNARDFDAAMAAARQVLAVLPGNQDATEILEQANAKKAAQPVFDASRQRAIAALDGHRQDEARVELERMRQLDPDHPAVALLERRIGAAAAPPPPSPLADLNELSLDPTGDSALHAQFGGGSEEPHIAFDPGATVAIRLDAPPAAAPPAGGSGLDELSLDSLDLAPPSAQVVPPPPDPYRSHSSPLGQEHPSPAPPVRGSPSDLWSEAPAEADVELPPLAAPPPPPPLAVPSPPPPEERSHEREIAGLLRQGDEAASRGDRQQAIEIWSRIFLIDINNSEAVSRIEKSRQDMAEGNRVISDGLKAGREKFEANDFASAREAFLSVLAVDENDPTARFYLDRIEEELARPPATAEMPGGGSPAAAGEDSRAPAAAAPAKSARPVRTPRTIAINPRVAGMIAVALVLIAVGVFFVFRGPKPGGPRKAAAAARPAASVAHARELADSGKVPDARAELRRIPPSSPEYAEARKMMAGLGKSVETTPGVSVAVATPAAAGAAAPVAVESESSRLRAAAEKALAEKHYIEALKNFHLAAAAFKDDPTFAQSMGAASDKVTALTPAVKLYNEGEYETAIPILWRITQDDRDNQDARSYLLRAYYNQGISQLQNGLYPKAIQSFSEALALDPADVDAARHKKFAERYQKGDLDLMGRIYVRHLNHRP